MSDTSPLTPEQFQNPEAIDRGAPFWAWNGPLVRKEMLRQIDAFHQMHMGGAHLHARVGLEETYLGERFLDTVRFCHEEFKKRGMLTWLYDEDRWPSGYAGGLVTKDRKYRAQLIYFTPTPLPVEETAANMDALFEDASKTGVLLAIYDIVLEKGYLASSSIITEPAMAKGDVWYAYCCLQKPSSWYNYQSYANVLDPATADRFLDITYETYYRLFGEEFGKSIPAIFTDEPRMQKKEFLTFSEAKTPLQLPFTYDMLNSYQETYGTAFLPTLPELFWNLPGDKPSVARYRYHDHTAERFIASFTDRVGKWCGEHNIMLTGHMNSEHDLYSQTSSIGDAMRCYRSFQQPGIDVLADHKEFVTAKQCVSVARQRGIHHVTCELYGVTNWDFPFSGYKLQGDWLAAMGITTRVHHLSLLGMKGESKRDYPASINVHVPWHTRFSLLEDHYARLNTALRRGKPAVRVGVIHPIESFWLLWGPRDANMTEREGREFDLQNVCQHLIFANIDFDFISESLLPTQTPEDCAAPLQVGEMAYDVVVVPGNLTIRSTTLERLKRFRGAGGKVIWAGDMPACVDGQENPAAYEFAKDCVRIPITRAALVRELNPYRDIEIRDIDGSLCNNLVYQLRKEGQEGWLFFCHALKVHTSWSPYIEPYLNKSGLAEHVVLRIKGSHALELYDTMTGKISPYPSVVKDGWTTAEITCYAHDSRLFHLKPRAGQPAPALPACQYRPAGIPLGDRFTYSLDEPNVLLLDMPAYRLDGGPWQPREEALRLDTAIRQKLGYPLRTSSMAQPYADPTPDVRDHLLELCYLIRSQIQVSGAHLAIEQPEYAEILLDGQKVEAQPDGFYVDSAIKTIPMPAFEAGVHELLIRMQFGCKSDLEWCYLLGGFGVQVQGAEAVLIPRQNTLAWDSIVSQGLPFYGGNVTYHIPFHCEAGAYKLRVPNFCASVLGVAIDGADCGIIAYSPYEVNLGYLESDSHVLELTVYGNRINSFGQVHLKDDALTYFGPQTWRSTGDQWTYEYRLKPQGVISSPLLLRKDD